MEALRVERLPLTLLRDAREDLTTGGASLRQLVWGIIQVRASAEPIPVDQRRIRYPHYRPPWGVHLEARLTVRCRYRGQTTPFNDRQIADGLDQLSGWIAAAVRLRSVE